MLLLNLELRMKHMKILAYAQRSDNENELFTHNHVSRPWMLEEAVTSIYRRTEMCIDTRGGYFEQFKIIT